MPIERQIKAEKCLNDLMNWQSARPERQREFIHSGHRKGFILMKRLSSIKANKEGLKWQTN